MENKSKSVRFRMLSGMFYILPLVPLFIDGVCQPPYWKTGVVTAVATPVISVCIFIYIFGGLVASRVTEPLTCIVVLFFSGLPLALIPRLMQILPTMVTGFGPED